MKLTIGKLALICGTVLVVLVLLNVFIFSLPSDYGRIIADALDRSDMAQTSVQICAGFLNIGSCRSAQTQTNSWRMIPSNGSGLLPLPVLLIFAAGFLSVVFIAWTAIWLVGNAPR